MQDFSHHLNHISASLFLDLISKNSQQPMDRTNSPTLLLFSFQIIHYFWMDSEHNTDEENCHYFRLKIFKIYCISTLHHYGGFSLTEQHLSKPAQFLPVLYVYIMCIEFACCCSSGVSAPRCLTLCGSALRRWRREGLMKWAFTGSLEWPQTSRPSKLRLTPVRDS